MKRNFWFYPLIMMEILLMITSSCEKDKTDPIIIWENPADITVGTLLSATQLNATADVPGTFVYTPPIGTVLSLGADQDLKVDFTPTDAATYNVASKTVKINVIHPAAVFNTTKTYFSMTDQDGNTYKTITIGTQTWMAENLRTTKYRNGDPIPDVTDNAAWEFLTTGAYCNYNNDLFNAATYGRLYNWHAVNDNRNIAPTGWHVPSAEEWLTLSNYLGGGDVAGGMLKETGTTHWESPNTGATNESGFTALPGGYRTWIGGFNAIGNRSYWWSSTSYFNFIFNTNNALIRYVFYDKSNFIPYNERQEYGYSVRCLKD